MATRRKRGKAWEFVIRSKSLLPRPLYLTFDSEAEGIEYCARLEALLKQGIVPDEVLARTVRTEARKWSLDDAINLYLEEVPVSKTDIPVLELVARRFGTDPINAINHAWATRFVSTLKSRFHAAPSTVRHYVGAVARCFDWLVRNRPHHLPSNPMRNLPRGYASYSPRDTAATGIAKTDVQRERRLSIEEAERILAVLNGSKPEGKQRPLALNHAAALKCCFALALESAMRLREMYTLDLRQIDFERRTIFLDITKNGSKRQVPMTTVAVDLLKNYFAQTGLNSTETDRSATPQWIFPWFDGNFSDKNLRRVTSLLSRQYARIFEAARCVDLRFHDLRHEATSRLYERTTLTDLQIAKITGHKTISMLARYANLRGSELATKLW